VVGWRMDGWLAGWLVGWLVGWLDGWLVGWLAGWLVARFIDMSDGICILLLDGEILFSAD
jgi:hypothetical protein